MKSLANLPTTAGAEENAQLGPAEAKTLPEPSAVLSWVHHT